MKDSDRGERIGTSDLVMMKKYWLGFDGEDGYCSPGNRVHGIYIGFNDDGYLMFFVEKDGKSMLYACQIGERFRYHGDVGGPYESYIPAVKVGEFGRESDVEYIMNRIRPSGNVTGTSSSSS